MRKVAVYRNHEFAGVLIEEHRTKYVFIYEDDYFQNDVSPAISLTIPKTKKEHTCEILFPFFFNMLSEGVNKRLQSIQLKIDEEDYFGLLMATAQYDTIGAISVKPIL